MCINCPKLASSRVLLPPKKDLLKINCHLCQVYTRGKLSKEQALEKAKHFCAYQERSHKEVKEKLYGFGLYRNEVDQLLSSLIEQDFLNEERYAVALAGGKFRMKHWGKIRIKQALQLQQVSPYNIKRALDSIDAEVYLQTLTRIAQKKLEQLMETDRFTRTQKAANYLLQKGFEPNLVRQVLQEQNGND